MASTHYSKLAGKTQSLAAFPAIPFDGQEFYHTTRHVWYRYSAADSQWYGRLLTTTTSTSTSTTTTSTSTTTISTSTTTTSTSSSTSTSISTSTSTSTTTTL